MIEIFDTLDIFELMFHYATTENCALVYFKNDRIKLCSEEKKAEIYSFYEEFLPIDILETLKQGRYDVVKFTNTDSAVMNAMEWFPAKAFVPDEDYFWNCYVIGPDGEFEYENLDPVKKTEEGA